MKYLIIMTLLVATIMFISCSEQVFDIPSIEKTQRTINTISGNVTDDGDPLTAWIVLSINGENTDSKHTDGTGYYIFYMKEYEGWPNWVVVGCEPDPPGYEFMDVGPFWYSEGPVEVNFEY